MVRRRRRGVEAFSLSFLDCICCGFGAIILLLVLSKIYEPVIMERSEQDLRELIAMLQEELFEIQGETTVLNRELVSARTITTDTKMTLAELQRELDSVQGQYQLLTDDAPELQLDEGELRAARQRLTEEMARLQPNFRRAPDDAIGGIPVDSEYIIFVIDTSGSMRSADKLPLVQRLLVDSLHLLSPADTVSIVTYAGSTAVALPTTEASERDTIKQAINSLAAAGSTAGAGGIQLAYAEAEAGFVQGGVNHVILCTDGDFNVGTSDTDALVDLIEKEREGGVTFTALGFGSDNLNDAMMEAISNAGNGTYAVITDEQHAHDYVTDKLFSSLQFIAKDMKLQVEFNPEHVLAYRLLGYENRAIADQDFRVDTVDAGEIGSGHRVTALYELVLAGDELPNAPNAPEPEDGAEYEEPLEVQAEDLALVKVRYKDVDADADSPAYEVNQALAADAVAEDPDALDADFRWAVAIASFAELLKESPYANASWLPAIADEFDTQKGRDDARARFTELFTKARPLITLPERPQPVRDAGVAEPIVPDAEAAPVGQDAGDDDFGADAGVDAAAP